MPKRLTSIAAALCTLAVAPATADGVPLVQSVPHIMTYGSARVDVVPDQADLFLGVETERPTPAAAADATAQAATDVIAAVKAQGIDARDISTTFTLAAVYDEDRDPAGRPLKRTLRGYKAEEAVTIRVRDVAKTGTLARTLIARGATSFRGFSFSYSKERGKQRELEAEATRDALAEARIYTDAIGVKLGRPLQIGSDGGPTPVVVAKMPSHTASKYQSSEAVVIPTEPGVQTISAEISVVWEIKGAPP